MMPAGESVPAFSWLLVYIGVGLGAASALIQVVMNWAQRSVSPTRATVIYPGEPVVAGILGRIAGARLQPGVFLGAALILVGVIDRKIDVSGRSVSVSVDLGGGRNMKQTQREFQ